MEIFLSFQGKISTTGHTRQKFMIRRYILPQLQGLMKFHKENNLPEEQTFSQGKIRSVGDFQFLPLVTMNSGKVIDFEIIILSQSEPASIKKYHTGDIDNLLKALLDGLRMPQNMNEVRTEKPLENETPFLCLMEDDGLVRNIVIRHDRLFFYKSMENQDPKEVFIIIKVKINPKF